MSIVKVRGVILRQTDAALLLVQTIEGERREFWIPLSQIHHISKSPLPDGWAATIELPDWLAIAKELEVEP